MPYNKNKVKVQLPHSSGHDLSHRNSGTLKVGQLTPLLVEEVIPKTRVNLNIPVSVQLPPLVSETYMNLKLKHEVFFVPKRILSASFQDWFVDQKIERITNPVSGSSFTEPTFFEAIPRLPYAVLTGWNGTQDEKLTKFFGAGSLADYLGMQINSCSGGSNRRGLEFQLDVFTMYHLIWQEWYRNTYVQKPAFVRNADNDGLLIFGRPDSPFGTEFPLAESLPYRYTCKSISPVNGVFIDNVRSIVNENNIDNWLCADGHPFFAMRQRNFGFDLFTSCRPKPQAGDPVSLNVTPNDGAGTFTIAQLRAANSLQQFRERNNIPGTRYVDQIMARYGCRPSDGVAQRPVLLGSSTMDVYSRGIDQTAAGSEGKNPFSGMAAQYGRAGANGTVNLVDDFMAEECGYIIVLQSLVPEVTYSTGIAPYLERYLNDGSIVEMANPLLQNVGDEPIKTGMLIDDGSSVNRNTIFGYNDRYCTFMMHKNEVHGELRDGRTLDAFVLQRSAGDTPLVISSEFLEIPQNYLDQVLAVSVETAKGVTAWYDAIINLRISNPLADYSMPSLQDPAYEHGETITLRRAGQII